jgi:hypothetical protein
MPQPRDGEPNQEESMMGLFYYVKQFTSLHWSSAPVREGIRFTPWREYPFGSFVFVIGVPSQEIE